MSTILVLTTCPDDETAARIARVLIEERLAACVNRLPGVVSTYRWHDRICEEREVLLLIKTLDARFDALRERVVALHPYEVPEVIAIAATGGLTPYLEWIAAQVPTSG